MGHDHVLTIPISIGPLILKVGLLATILAVTGFALVRAFLADASRTEAAVVSSSAAAALLLQLMLAPPVGLPSQIVVLLLATATLPPILILVGENTVVRRMRVAAPWIFSTLALPAAGLSFGYPTISVLAGLGGLSWFAVRRVHHLIPRVLAGLSAISVLGSATVGAMSQWQAVAQFPV